MRWVSNRINEFTGHRRHRTRSTRRAPRRSLAFIGLALMILSLQAPLASSAEVEVISSTDTQIVFEIRTSKPGVESVEAGGRSYLQIIGTGPDQEPIAGLPDLPVEELTVALPPGTEAVASLIDYDVRPLAAGRPLPHPIETIHTAPNPDGYDSAFPSPDQIPMFHFDYQPDPNVYNSGESYPANLVSAQIGSRWRALRISTIKIHPVQFRPEVEELRWYPRMRVQVNFIQVAGLKSDARERSVPDSEPRWDALYRANILNYDRIRAYKRAPLGPRIEKHQVISESNFEIRIDLHRTDLYYLSYEDLEATGAFSGALAWDTIGLVMRDYNETDGAKEWPVAYLPNENDDDNHFGPGDGIYFYGQDAWDFFDLPPGEKRYLRTNAYWFVCGPSAGTQMEQLPAWYDLDDLSAPLTYQRTIRYEENVFYSKYLVDGDIKSYSYGPQSIKTDHYSWTHPDPISTGSIQAVPLTLPYVDSIVDLRVKLQGIEIVKGQSNHFARLWLSNSDTVDLSSLAASDTAWAFPGNPYRVPLYQDSLVTIEGDLADSSPLRSGPANYLKIYLPWAEDGLDGVKEPGMGIDWVEVTYEGKYRMANHRLQIKESASDTTEIRLTHVADTGLLAIDITDSLSPKVIVIPSAQFEPSGSRYNLPLQIDFGETEQSREILFVEPDYVTNVTSDQLSVRGESLPSFTGQDYISICSDQFAASLTPLLSQRAAQGHQVLSASLEEIFAQYSGGRRHPYAIKYFLRDIWTAGFALPDYLLLIGDGSVDIAGYATSESGGESDYNFLPAPTVPGYVIASGTSLVTLDHWYVDNLGGDWDDLLSRNPDLHLGRVSCGTNAELETYVTKVLTYENEGQTSNWRSRLLIHADDQFSIGGDGIYNFNNGESSFTRISRNSITPVNSDAAFAHYEIDSLFQSTLMDSVASLGRCELDPEDNARCLRDPVDGSIDYVSSSVEVNQGDNTDYGKTVVADKLITSLTQGALVWAYQGHSNRRQITDEAVFMHKDGFRTDCDKLTNIHRPYLFVGAGCHLVEYASAIEASSRLGGDGMAEVMMLNTENRYAGAIGAYASSDYETVGHDMESKFFTAMFSSPPGEEEGENPGVRWRMGELTTASKMLVSSGSHQRVFYMLLGDPALRMGVSPPVMNITLNGMNWDSDPGNSEPYISDREDDSLHVVVQLLDESSIPNPEISDYNGLVPADSIQVIEQTSSGRHFSFSYRTQIQRRPYSLQIKAIDYDGATRESSIEIPFEVTYFENAKGRLVTLAPNAFIQPQSKLVVKISTGAHMSEDDVELFVGETSLALLSHEMVNEGGPYLWTLTYESLASLLPAFYDLTLKVIQHNGEPLVVSELPVELGEDSLRFKNVWWIPSPFDDQTTLVYDLSLPASRVSLRIFTVSGRCILDQDSGDIEANLYPPLPVAKGIVNYDAPVWNGRDDDGDQVGNGTYFFELTVWDDEGKRADTVLDKLVRVR